MEKRICELYGYENIRDCYFVSDKGEITSYAENPIYKIEKGLKLKTSIKTGGYVYVCLIDNSGKKKYCRVHRIVAQAFKPNKNESLQVNHIDRNKLNNAIDNLEWVTAEKNSKLANSKELYCYNLDGELVKHYKYAVDVINDGFGSHAYNVARGIERTHKKHYFSYIPLKKSEVLQRLSKIYPTQIRIKK